MNIYNSGRLVVVKTDGEGETGRRMNVAAEGCSKGPDSPATQEDMEIRTLTRDRRAGGQRCAVWEVVARCARERGAATQERSI